MEGDIITMQEVYKFEQTGMSADGTVEGYFHATGIRPKFAERLRRHGIPMPEALFDPTQRYA